MTLKSILAANIAVLLMGGCAHSINIAPNLTSLDRSQATAPRIPANVGYYIPPEASSIEITTPGGGPADKVAYFPYRDIEAGFQKILSNVFMGVVKLTSIAGSSRAPPDGIDYIIVPVVITRSGGSNFFTWPPSSFTVDLTSNIRDPVGKMITSLRVVGNGSAETGERLSEYGIAGRRAMEDASLKMQASLLEGTFRSTKSDARATQPQGSAGPSTASARLAEIKELREKGLISQEEYESKRKAILDSL
jgi:hypothetical protein